MPILPAYPIMINVRPYREGDLDKVLEIENVSFKFPYSMDLFRRLLAQKSTRMLVAQNSGGNVVGYILYSIRPGKCLIISLAVLPEFRRRGVGAMLMQALIKDVGPLAKYIELQVGCGNIDAVKFYQKFGFKVEGVLRRYYPDGEDAYYMVKILDGKPL